MGRILITGASGFIGSHLVNRLHPEHEIFALGRTLPKPVDNDRIAWIACDLASPFDYQLLPRDIDTVIHLAQSRDYRSFPDRAQQIFDVNVSGTMRLLDWARIAGVSRFVYAGSGGIYKYNVRPIAEDDPKLPEGFYLCSKFAVETLLRPYESLLSTIVLRLFFVYGPGQQPGMLIPGIARKVLSHQTVRVDGNPGLRVNPIHVTDAVRAFERAVALTGSWQVNVAGDEVVSISGLASLIGEVAGVPVELAFEPARLDGDLVADTKRMRDVLEVVPTIHLRQGLSGLVHGLAATSAQ